MSEIDMTRVLCAEADLRENETRSFTVGSGDWPLRGFLLRTGGRVHAYVNHCPHAGHPLNLRPNEFLTADRSLIVCNSHGALFEKETGYCVAGPCAGQSLQRVPIRIEAGLVILAADGEAD
ncbi:MAG TPA: Rieske (2Fe-2S) protein [Steroidobacteraceae bacterium]